MDPWVWLESIGISTRGLPLAGKTRSLCLRGSLISRLDRHPSSSGGDTAGCATMLGLLGIMNLNSSSGWTARAERRLPVSGGGRASGDVEANVTVVGAPAKPLQRK